MRDSKRPRHHRLNRQEQNFAYAALIPILLYLGVFVLLPIGVALYTSFQDTFTERFVGLGNYYEALFEDRIVLKSLINTLLYSLIRIPATIIPGFFLAILLDKTLRFERSVIIGAIFTPYVTNLVAYCSVFLYLFSNGGFLNAILRNFGLPPQPFIFGIKQALPSIALMDALKHIGFDTIIILSALQDIPRPLYESAKIDGASNRQIIYRVVLPLLKPTLLYLTIMLSIWTIQVFEPIFVMTKGEPFNATRTMVYNIFDMAFYAMRLGYASAISFILFAIVLAISYAQIKAGRTRWEY